MIAINEPQNDKPRKRYKSVTKMLLGMINDLTEVIETHESLIGELVEAIEEVHINQGGCEFDPDCEVCKLLLKTQEMFDDSEDG